jgi:hypothetical protein
MGFVMIRCPATGTAIRTGIKSERSRFASTPVFFARTLCPMCRVNHEWFAADAWVEEERAFKQPEAA